LSAILVTIRKDPGGDLLTNQERRRSMKKLFVAVTVLMVFTLLMGGWGSAWAPAALDPITFIHPAPGEVIHPSNTTDYTIEWSTANPEAVRFKLYASLDNGATWLPAFKGKVSGTTYATPIDPSDRGNMWVRFKVNGYTSEDVKVATGTTDKVLLEVIRLTEPDTGAGPFIGGQPGSISWQVWETVDNIKTVKLYYTLNSGIAWKKIASLTIPPYTNQNSINTYDLFTWPAVGRDKTKCKVKVVLIPVAGHAVFPTMGKDVSSEPFTIQQGP
jgi:hypothetical protein